MNNKKNKLTDKHFQLFQKECEKWIKKLKLDNWEVHYDWQESKENRASCISNLNGYIITLLLSKKWENYEKVSDSDICQVAKHEVIHILMARFSTNAKSRYVSSDDMEESGEELVRKLEKLL